MIDPIESGTPQKNNYGQTIKPKKRQRTSGSEEEHESKTPNENSRGGGRK